VDEFIYGPNDGLHDKLCDFYLKVHWYEGVTEVNDENSMNNAIKSEKVIKRKDIIEKFHAIRHACKALEHLNKRYKSKHLANNYIRVHEVS
jgi:hypothetical protein